MSHTESFTHPILNPRLTGRPLRAGFTVAAPSKFAFPTPCRGSLGFLPAMLLALLLQSFVSIGQAGTPWDWPQILGPDRNGVAADETLLKEFPEAGLKKLWSYPVGEGYAGPAVVEDRVIVFHRVGNDQFADCLDLADGQRIWRTRLPATYRSGGIDSDTGPKCVPLIDEGRVFLYDAAGMLFCLQLSDGQEIWRRDLADDFRAPPGYFGFGSAPLAIGDSLLINVGGREAGIVALDAATGQTRWQATDERASYSAPVAARWQNRPIALFVTRLNFLGIDPADGAVLFEAPFGKRGPTVNGASPVLLQDGVVLTASYGVGAQRLKWDGSDVASVWANPLSLESQYSTPILHQGYLYGSSGREDRRNGSYRCIDPGTGRVVWSQANLPVGHTIRVGDELIVLDCTGGLHVVAAQPEGFQRRYRTELFAGPARGLPAVSDGRLLARSNFVRGEAELACFQVGPFAADAP